MSRTDKTRPYWVKVNDHGVEHHDHSHLGEEVWRERVVRDENGEIVTRESEVYRSAYDIVREQSASDRNRLWFGTYWHLHDDEGRRCWGLKKDDCYNLVPNNWVIDRARRAINEGDHSRLIHVGYAKVNVFEKYLAYTIADHCTIDEKRQHTGWARAGAQPCYMEADWRGEDRNQFRCSCCMCSGRDPHFERARRRNKRDELRKATKLANSGREDWADDWNDLKVTTPLRYNAEWC
jgi:hypothetical protein